VSLIFADITNNPGTGKNRSYAAGESLVFVFLPRYYSALKNQRMDFPFDKGAGTL
jgi:hypothetical protein